MKYLQSFLRLVAGPIRPALVRISRSSSGMRGRIIHEASSERGKGWTSPSAVTSEPTSGTTVRMPLPSSCSATQPVPGSTPICDVALDGVLGVLDGRDFRCSGLKAGFVLFIYGMR